MFVKPQHRNQLDLEFSCVKFFNILTNSFTGYNYSGFIFLLE